MKNLALGLSALAMTVTLGGAAIAAADAPAMERAMANATITRAQAQARAEAAFAKLDVNHDGKLDKADRAAREGEHFDKMDTNHDGQISRDEFTAAHDAMKGMMGRGMMGHDMPPPPPAGAMEGMEHGPAGGMDHAGMGRKGMMMRGGQMGMLMGILRAADPQHTGTVSKDAFVGAALKMFDDADANHDGKVTPDERKAAMRAKMGALRGMRGHAMQHGDMTPPAKPAGQ